ncbi:hypothetical protein CASFOL_003040 [Castilleja foliolosa]|uniref:Uncharacterized protein n=1 Tax=Castilleja foliolosa TaxID=1961234 RepID=A0ABD3DPT9_9LAMI
MSERVATGVTLRCREGFRFLHKLSRKLQSGPEILEPSSRRNCSCFLGRI